MDKIVSTIQQIDIRNMKLPIIAVFEHPEDYPDKCVGRIFEVDQPTEYVVIKDSIQELQYDIGKHFVGVFLTRAQKDVPSLVGCWV